MSSYWTGINKDCCREKFIWCFTNKATIMEVTFLLFYYSNYAWRQIRIFQNSLRLYNQLVTTVRNIPAIPNVMLDTLCTHTWCFLWAIPSVMHLNARCNTESAPVFGGGFLYEEKDYWWERRNESLPRVLLYQLSHLHRISWSFKCKMRNKKRNSSQLDFFFINWTGIRGGRRQQYQ